ncbi:hypothetical protein U1Q18_052580 [Sarracenia purpurea var. burkii]
MATRRGYLQTPSYFFVAGGQPENSFVPCDSQFEFDDESSQVCTSPAAGEILTSSEPRKPAPTSSRPTKNPARKTTTTAATGIDHRRSKPSSSMPVNIPDWSKILRDECSERRRRDLGQNNATAADDDDADDDDDEDGRIPPHEYLARTRMASFSVQEGIGRTLKGRDLSRVRNAIWKQTGFED